MRETFDYVRYLKVKKTIDDSSLNGRVWKAMADWMNQRGREEAPLRILEIGAGIGTMIERLLDAGLLHQCVYTALEMEPGFREAAFDHLDGWRRARGFRLHRESPDYWRLDNTACDFKIHWVTGDALEVHERFAPDAFDLVIGHAVIDLLPVTRCLPVLLTRVRPGGACYFSVNYAGQTIFQPPHPFDETVIRAYHRDMDACFPDDDWQPSQTGRRLGSWLSAQGHRLVAEGESDWKLPRNAMDADTVQFIANILDTIETALAGLPELPDWMAARRRQLQSGALQFRAANRDCFALMAKRPPDAA